MYLSPISRRFVCVLLFCLGGSIAVSPPLLAQEFAFTRVVDTNDPVPGGGGALFVPAERPALDAGTVIFRNGNTLAPDSIWSVAGEDFTKLVDLNTSVPDGTGKFSSLILDFSAPGYPVLSNGTVIFVGRDSASSGYTGGLYSVPATGGAITRIANRNVAIPGAAGNFTGGLQFFSIDGGKVAFNGVGTSITGIYTANTNGTSLTDVADSDHPAHPEFLFPIGNFAFPSIDGTTVAFYGNGVFDPSTGYNALYNTPSSGGFAYTEPATSEQALPGDSTVVFHTRYGSPRVDGSTVFFRADDANTASPNFTGLFSVPKGGGSFTNLVDINDTLAGLTNINSNSFQTYSAEGGLLAFTAQDDFDHYGVYSHSGSTTAKVLATGDSGPFSDLHATIYSPTIGSEAVDSGSIILLAGVRFSASGIYIATPIALSADLSAAMSFSPAYPTLGTDTTLSVTVTNNGPATAQTVSLVVKLPPDLTFKSAAGGTFDAGTNAVTFSFTSLAPTGVRNFGIVATANSMGPLTASAYVTSAQADPDERNSHGFATANAIFASTGNWVVRKIVDDFTPVPDRTGENFLIGGGVDPLPAVDGGKVAFIQYSGGSNLPSIWSANTDGSGGLTRLVDTNTNVPSGGGAKFGYLKNVRLRNDTVVFLGYGADQLHDGFYSLPIGGGTIKSVATTETVKPGGDGSKFGYQDFIQSFSDGYVSDGQKAFTVGTGVYVFPVGGGAGMTAVYPGSNIPIAGNSGSTFAYSPAISGNRIAWEISGGFAVLGSFLDHRHFYAIGDAATESPSTPGQNFSAAGFSGPQIEGETAVFHADSGAGNSINGIYSVTGDGTAVKLVDTNTDVPGGHGKFKAFNSAGSPDSFALSDGEVVFLGVDEDNRAGLYSIPASGGTITKIVAVGDMIGNLQITGTPGFSSPPFQPNSLGEHQIAFRADYTDTVANQSSPAIFVASRVDNRLANISTRLTVGTSDNVLIGGFIISGTEQKSVILRGLGPSLANQNVPNVLADPTLELHDGAGATVASNDNWRDTQEAVIESTGIPPSNDLESAIVATVDPGNYTAILRGKNNGTGNGLVEIYDLGSSTDLGTRLVNISTRGFVQIGDNVMIGGIIIQGAVEKHVLIRALGPSLSAQNVPSVLADPTLDVADVNGAVLASNDNWRDTQEDAIIASTIPPTNDFESAIDIRLLPGNYTAIVRGNDSGTGNALVEFYELP